MNTATSTNTAYLWRGNDHTERMPAWLRDALDTDAIQTQQRPEETCWRLMLIGSGKLVRGAVRKLSQPSVLWVIMLPNGQTVWPGDWILQDPGTMTLRAWYPHRWYGRGQDGPYTTLYTAPIPPGYMLRVVHWTKPGEDTWTTLTRAEASAWKRDNE